MTFKMPDMDTLRQYVDEARIKTLENLLKKAKDGDATAAEYGVLLKVAREVEELIPHSVKTALAEVAHNLLTTPAVDLPWDEEEKYDPNTPLDHWQH